VKQSRASSFAVLIVFILTILPGPAWSQSGRGRPRVPTRESAAPAPPPVNIPASTSVVKKEQTGSLSKFLLRNGITVVISEQHAAPIAATVAYFKAGRASEPVPANGISRLLANAIITGAGKNGSRAVTDLRALGGQLTADATDYGTSFNILSSPGKLPDALAVQAAMLKSPSLSDEELRLNALIESDDPAARAKAGLYKLVFPVAVATVEAQATREQALAFYRAHYRPENLIISVAGDVVTFNTLVKIQQLYADFGAAEASGGEAGAEPRKPNAGTGGPARTARPSPPGQKAKPEAARADATNIPPVSAEQGPPVSPPQPGLRYGTERADITQSIVTVGCRVSGSNLKEEAALELLAAIIARGRSSRLNRPTLDGTPSLTRADSDYIASADQGLLTVQMWVPPTAIDKAESDLFREMDRLRRELASEADIARARSVVEKNVVDEMATYLGRARLLARAEATGIGPRSALDYRTRIRAVTAQDIQGVAAKYFMPPNISVFEYESFSAPERTFDSDRFTKAVLAWAPAFGRGVEPGIITEATPDPATPLAQQGAERSLDEQAVFESVEPLAVKDFSTLNGPRAYVREDHSQPSVAVSILFQTGRLGEDETTSGLTELMVQSMLYGTERRSAVQVAHEIEQLGGELQTVSDPDFFGFTLSVLSRNVEPALKIVRDIIEGPAFRAEDVDRARAVQMGRIREARDSGLARSRDLLFEGLFSGHPYALPARGREEVVAKIKGEQLQAWHDKTVKRQFPLIIVVGDTQGSALVSSVVAGGFRRREVDRTFGARIPAPKPSVEKIESRNRRLSAFSLGFNGPKAGSPEVDVIKLIGAALSESGGRLLTELRDRQAVAYAADLENESLLTGGAIYLKLLTTSENESRARASALAELDRLARTGLTADEMQSAVEAATVDDLALLQHQEARALRYAQAIYSQKQAAEVDSLNERLSKLTTDDVKRVASQYFKPSLASTGAVRGTQKK